MKHGSFLVVVSLLALAAPSATQAQGLGDAAARARQKRKEQSASTPTKVFTDADLDKGKPNAAAPGDDTAADKEAAAKPDAAKAGGSAKPGAKDDLDREREERKLQEAEWRVRFANAREQLAQAEAACWQEVVRTEYYQGVPVQMKVREFVESTEFRQAKQALADLEEQFRRTGLPPGWARPQ
jgi:hypothetical protein